MRRSYLLWLFVAIVVCASFSFLFNSLLSRDEEEEDWLPRNNQQAFIESLGCDQVDENSLPDVCFRVKAEAMIAECNAATLESFAGSRLRSANEDAATIAKDDTAIYFLHIEKCGGSSMWNFIRKNEGVKAINLRFPWRLGGFDLAFNDSHSLSPRELVRARDIMQPARVIIGHYVHGIHEITAERPYMYVTMMREPLDRLVSQYYFWRKLYNTTYGDDLVDFLTSTTKPQAAHKDNLMTRVLCGREAYLIPRGKLTYRHMYCAMQHLLNYSMVLFTDRYDASIQIMRTTFLWPYATQVVDRPTLNNGKHKNENKKQPREVLEAAKPLVKYDNYLYRLGDCMWHLQKQRYRHLLPDPSSEVPSDKEFAALLKEVEVPKKLVIQPPPKQAKPLIKKVEGHR
ncbi:hypothetical protein QOT17_015549 [Balamuthia mandrillaris]